MIASLSAEVRRPKKVESLAEAAALLENRERANDLIAKLDALKDDIEVAQSLCDVLGNQGLKSYIFDSVTPELNRLIAEYMAVLNPDLSVEVCTVSKLKSGEFREKFAVKVDNEHGSGSYEGSSGGERQMVNLALALAFNTVVRSMSGNALNVLFLDEPLESLDESASERALELCAKFVSHVPTVFIVSHNPAIRDLVSDKITIVKRGGMAALS